MHQPCLVIMAAGMGSRFGGPKQTTPVDEYGHFLLHYSLFDAYRAGFRKVVFVVKEETAEEFRESVGPAVAAAFDVRYAYQKLDTLPEAIPCPTAARSRGAPLTPCCVPRPRSTGRLPSSIPTTITASSLPPAV